MDRHRSCTRLLAALLGLALVGLPGAALAQEDVPGEVAQPGGTLPGEPAIELVQVATGLADPVNIAAPDDGTGRLFVVERPGTIRIIEEDGTLRDEPFLDISNTVKTDFLEQGLLGLAFPPDFGESGLFYVYYSDFSTNGAQRIVRFSVGDDQNVADPESAELILEIGPDPYVNHNGGNLEFGPDGYLYWSTGDGGRAGDPYGLAQDVGTLFGNSVTTLFGIIGRIDVDPEGTERYAIPPDNPFAEAGLVQLTPDIEEPAFYHPGARREIWAYGLRNPWQFSFDPANGDLYIADVGQNAWEEINYQPADAGGGQNYGWDFLEASHCYPAQIETCPRQQVGVLPVAEISHEGGDCSITGLGVHRGPASASLDGIYLASDFCSGRIWGLARDEGGTWQLAELLDTTLLVAGGGNDAHGDVYLTDCGGCTFGRDYDPLADPSGSVWRIVSADEVPEGATTAPLEGQAEPPEEASPSPEVTPDATPEMTPEPTQEATPEPTEEATPEPEPTLPDREPVTETPTPEPTEEATPEPEPTPANGDEAGVVERNLVAQDIAFGREEIAVPQPGVSVELTLVNRDPVEHNFALYQTEDADEAIFVGELFAGPDAERVYEFEAPEEPGEYFFRCDVHPQQMTGTFIVRSEEG